MATNMIASILWIQTGTWYSDLVVLGFHIALVLMLIGIPYKGWKEWPEEHRALIKAHLKAKFFR